MSTFSLAPMNAFKRVFGVGQGALHLRDLLDLSPLQKQQIGYVVKVLNICFFWCCFVLLGIWIDQLYDIEKMPSMFAGSMALLCMYRSPSTPDVWVGKLGLIMIAGFCEGLLAGGVVKALIGRDHQYVMISVVGVMGVLLIFAAAVQLQKQRIAFYGGGVIASFGLLGYLKKNMDVFELEQETMIGLMCFGVYLCFCCQVWLSVQKHGELDFVSHALYLPAEPLFVLMRLIAVNVYPKTYKQQQQYQRQGQSVAKSKPGKKNKGESAPKKDQ